MLTIHYPPAASYVGKWDNSKITQKPDAQLKNGATDLILKLSQSKSWGERQEAAKKLGEMKITEAVPELSSVLLKDSFWMVRYAAVQALIMIGDSKAIPSLTSASMNDNYQVVRSFAEKAICKINQAYPVG